MDDDLRLRIIAMTEAEWSAYVAALSLHRHHIEPCKQWRRDAKAAARKAKRDDEVA